MKRLIDARDGAISVFGMFMALFLTGGIWYTIGIGDSILYRERVQDAADAVAFAGAVYHARGMNIIVTLNILMAALLGLVVLARLLRFLNDSANAISCGCTAIPFIGAACGSVCGVTSGAKTPLRSLETTLTNLYNKVGPALSKTQRGVARAMPWVAEVKAVGVSLTHAPDVRFGAIASFSLVTLPGDERLGLPVQEGDDAVLCGKVSSGLVDLVFEPFDGIPGVGLIKGWLEDPLEDFVSNFCEGKQLVDPETVAEIQKKEEDDQVDKRCDWEQQISSALAQPWQPLSMMRIKSARADHASGEANLTEIQCYGVQKNGLLANLPAFGSYAGQSVPTDVSNPPDVGELLDAGPGEPAPPSTLGCAFDRGTCEAKARSDIQAKREQAKQNGEGEATDIDPAAREQTKPKIVYEPAENGDAYFQVWSIVYASNARAARPSRGVEIASRTQQSEALDFWSRLGWAQAEFYYDHEGPWTPDISTNEAMWNLRWRARLRRVRPPTVNVLENWAGPLLGKIEGRVSQLLGLDDAGDDPNDSVSDVLEVLLEFGFEEASKAVEERVMGAAVAGDDAIEEKARDAWQTIGGVH